jgi:transposase
MAQTRASTGASTGADTVAMERVEIVTRGERRRSYTLEDKARLLAETAEPGVRVRVRVLEVAQRHGISPSLLHRWRREAEGRPLRKIARPVPRLVPLLVEAPGAASPDVHDGCDERRGGGDDRGSAAQRPGVAGWRVVGHDGCRPARRGARGVIALPPGARILLATQPVDFRKGAHGLAALAAEALGEDPFSGVVIVFRSKRADRIKVLLWDTSGLVLIWKQIEGGAFRWPPIVDGVMRLTPPEFAALFAGLDWTRMETPKRIPRPTAVA